MIIRCALKHPPTYDMRPLICGLLRAGNSLDSRLFSAKSGRYRK
jgi:hypothetical protein